MQKTFIIKPSRPDVKVRDPITLRHLSAEGEQKPRTTHWIRLLNRGEVVEVTAKQTTKTTAEEKAADKKGGK